MAGHSLPMLEKMHLVQRESQIIGEFLDWLLNQKGLRLAHYVGESPFVELVPYRGDDRHPLIEALLAEYFDIDLDQAERERRALLDKISKCKEVIRDDHISNDE